MPPAADFTNGSRVLSRWAVTFLRNLAVGSYMLLAIRWR
ncbi:MAG: hypothetical protein QOK38_2205 [Acidobacteriaceae bacterium]|jgi:hypothetical protein|nr:hypothetical protein [Acidobacteriaceae bacterium]